MEIHEVREQLNRFGINTDHICDEALSDQLDTITGCLVEVHGALQDAYSAALPDIARAVEAFGYAMVAVANIMAKVEDEESPVEHCQAG